jgi:type VI secretion system protein ImpC
MARESIQDRISRTRPPRTNITYECFNEIRALPFVIGVLGDFSGHRDSTPPSLSDRQFIDIDVDNFDRILAEFKPALKLQITNQSEPGGPPLDLRLHFASLNSFSPAHLVQQLESLNHPGDKQEQPASNNGFDSIDGSLSAQVNEILHAPEFQRLEASWRGLHYLASHSETGPPLRIRVLDVSIQELRDDLIGQSLDGSALYPRLNSVFRAFGDAPFGVLIGDYEFGYELQDVRLLERIAELAAAIHSPFIAAAAPRMFGVREFRELDKIRDLVRDLVGMFDQNKYDEWRAFRRSENSRYIGLCLPRALMRSPYEGKPESDGIFHFEEDTGGADQRKFLWGNAAYPFAQRLAEAFARYHWLAAIKGLEGGGLVDNLPTWIVRTDDGDYIERALDWRMDDRQESLLSQLGYLCLLGHVKGAYAVFFGANSCHQPAKHGVSELDTQARMSAQFPVIFALSRFAHYLKAIMRDRIGGFISRADCERFLNSWITNYVELGDQATHSQKSARPLRNARIDVAEIPGKPGVYRASVCLRPHFQIDDMGVDFRFEIDVNESNSLTLDGGS